MLMDKEMLQSFDENGYVLVRSCINRSCIDEILETLLILCRKYAPDHFDKVPIENIIDNKLFHKALIELRQENPRIGGAIYDSLHCSLSIQTLMADRSLVGIVAALLRSHPRNMMSFSHLLRIDAARDTRNAVGWHQDFMTEENTNCEHGVTVWIPLQRVNTENGTMEVCPGSHRERIIHNATKVKRKATNTSDLYNLPESTIAKYTVVPIEADVGDAVIISMNLIHRSGFNNSEYIRFTAVARFFSMIADSFIPGWPQYIPSRL